jgi:hypothetical protein
MVKQPLDSKIKDGLKNGLLCRDGSRGKEGVGLHENLPSS